jgi:hypothetical protein
MFSIVLGTKENLADTNVYFFIIYLIQIDQKLPLKMESYVGTLLLVFFTKYVLLCQKWTPTLQCAKQPPAIITTDRLASPALQFKLWVHLYVT